MNKVDFNVCEISHVLEIVRRGNIMSAHPMRFEFSDVSDMVEDVTTLTKSGYFVMCGDHEITVL